MEKNVGKIVQIIGPVLDVKFEGEQLPNINDAVVVKYNDRVITAEVAQHVGDNTVRCISMSSTDGLVRGIDVINTNKPISVPVGEATLGRLLNVLGETIDKKENDYIEKEYFSMFKPYNYYTYVKVDKKVIKFKPKNFKATIENYKLCYSFDINGEFDIKNTIFEFGDSDFYVAMVLKDEFVTIKGASGKVSGIDNDFYYGYKLEFK